MSEVLNEMSCMLLQTLTNENIAHSRSNVRASPTSTQQTEPVAPLMQKVYCSVAWDVHAFLFKEQVASASCVSAF